jgi:transposase
MPLGETMDSAQSAVTKVIAAKRPKRRLRSAEEKKRIVEETMAKGASVARVAQAHGVHISQIYDWRKEYRTEKQRAKRGRGVNLLPVAVSGNDGAIEIELAKGKVRIVGADAALLRSVLEMLR